MFRALTIIFLSLLILGPLQSQAQVYKYVDKHGKTHYSDSPFAFKQKDFSQGNEDATLKATDIISNREDLKGEWDLFANSMHLGSDTIKDRGKWAFHKDGSITRAKKKDLNISQYRIHRRMVEIIEDDKWIPYRVITLNKDKLTLRNHDTGKVYYFKRSLSKTILPGGMSQKSLYRRDQVADLILFFTCSDIVYDKLSKEEKIQIKKEIFEETNVENFNAEKFSASVEHYKDENIFVEKYQPMIAKETQECQRTNIVPKIDMDLDL